MGCCINIDFSIFKDKIIIIALVLIVILSGVLIHMIQTSSPQSPQTLPGHDHNHTKIITTWTLIPTNEHDCRIETSQFGGSGLNSSTHGSCHQCNCTSVQTTDI